jgi:hypothetical protein
MQKGTGMTDKSVQKLSKRELLEILVSQGKQIEKLQEDLKLANEQLQDRKISIENSGSIAEASLKVNNIFADADAACQQYLENIMDLEQQQQEALDRISEKEAQVDQLLQQTKAKAGRRTMPSWAYSRADEQAQEVPEEVGESSWAKAPTQTRATRSANSANSVRTAQTQPQTQAQTKAVRTAAPRTVTSAARTTAAVTRPTTVTRTAQTAPAARATTVTRPTVVRQATNTATVTAAPKTKRRVS